MSLKLLVVLFTSVSFVIAFNVDANSSNKLSFNGRGIGKNINLIIDLFKMSQKKDKSTPHLELVPHDGLGYKYHLRHHHVEESTVPSSTHKPEKPVKEPKFWFFDKFSNNMDYAFITKILLKLIVFKKIVKFIALICLLFLIPALNSKDGDDSDDDKMARNLDPYGNVYIDFPSTSGTNQFFISTQTDYRTKEVYSFAINAIEGFSSDKVVWCIGEHDIYCRFQTMFDNIDQSYTVDK